LHRVDDRARCGVPNHDESIPLVLPPRKFSSIGGTSPESSHRRATWHAPGSYLGIETSFQEGSRKEMDRKKAFTQSLAQGVPAMKMPWSTVMILLAGIFLILTYA
jgi:hypothetical protein